MNHLAVEADERFVGNQNILERIDKYLKILQLESCLELYFRLLIYGRSTPADLRAETMQSKATIFRNLALLLETGLIARETDDDARDKRYNLYYHVNKTLSEFTGLKITEDLETHAARVNKKELLEKWRTLLEKLPAIFTNLSTRIFINCQLKCGDAITPLVIPKEKFDGVIPPGCKVMVFSIFDNEEKEQILDQFNQFLDNLDLGKLRSKRDMRKPMKDPVAISVNLIRFHQKKR